MLISLNETMGEYVYSQATQNEIIIPIFLAAIISILATWLVNDCNIRIHIFKDKLPQLGGFSSLIDFCLSVFLGASFAILFTLGTLKLLSFLEYLFFNFIATLTDITMDFVKIVVDNLLVCLILLIIYFIVKEKKSQKQKPF